MAPGWQLLREQAYSAGFGISIGIPVDSNGIPPAQWIPMEIPVLLDTRANVQCCRGN